MANEIRIEQRGHVRTIRMCRPEVKNAINSALGWGVVAALHDLGIADADIKTTQLYVSPMYNYGNSQTISGYQMSNIISVHVRDLAVPNVVILTDSDATIATVVPPTVMEEKPAEDVAVAEGAAAEPEVITKGKKEEEGEGEGAKGEAKAEKKEDKGEKKEKKEKK